MEYNEALQGIGQVKINTECNRVMEEDRKHPDLYKIKGSKDINIELDVDSETCVSWGSCVTEDDQLLVTDFNNKNIKRVDLKTMTVVDYCSVDSKPNGICCIGRYEAAVACRGSHRIQFVSFKNKMTLTKDIKVSHVCLGIAYKNEKFYVTDYDKRIYVYDLTGSLLHMNTQTVFRESSHISFNKDGTRMYVAGWTSGLICYDGNGKYVTRVNDDEVKGATGVCTDYRGNVFVAGWDSHNVVQYSEDGWIVGRIVKKEDGIMYPNSVSFHPELGYLFVTMCGKTAVKMFELE